ncbi:PAS domain S-box protein [bacterium]|nr:PAS domain S-box protein [bacterium]
MTQTPETKPLQAKRLADEIPMENSEKLSYDELLRKATEAQERWLQSQSRLNETQRIAHLGSWEWDVESRHLGWSQESYRLFGLEPGDEERDNLTAFVAALHPGDRNKVSKATARALRHSDVYIFDYRIIRADNGRERIIHTQAEVIRDPDDNTPLKMVGTIQDVTSQRQTLQKLELLQSAIDQTSETIVITDREAKIIYANPAFTEITGYSLEEAVGNNPSILQSGQTKPEVFKKMWRTLVAKKNWRGHFYNKRKDGTLYEEEVSISPLVNHEQEISHYIAVKRDVSDENQLRRQLQQAQKMEAIGTLAGGIAHDFNNILTILVGNLELAMMFELEENHPALKGLEKALAAGQRAKELVSQILTFSRRQPDELHPLKATPIIKEATKLINASLPATIELQTTINAPKDMISAAPGPLHQILVNLSSNATQAMRDHGGKLEIQLTNRTLDATEARQYRNFEAGDFLELKVIDSGPGIAPEIANKIFEPYFTTKPVGQGSGLGLATVHGLVKKLGGAISLESEPGSGCSFTLLLPTIDYHASITNSLTDFLELPTGSEELLLVDDEKDILELNQRALEKLGYRVSICNNGNSALQMIKRNPEQFDLVLTDMTMPGISGTQLAIESLKLNPNLPIILGTGYNDTINRKDALTVGIKEFYNKPLSTNRLVKLVRKVLNENLKPHKS